MDFLDTFTKNNIFHTGIQKKDNRLKEEAILYPFFFVVAVLTLSVIAYLFLYNESQHSQRVADLEKLLNEARAEIRDDTACALGVRR